MCGRRGTSEAGWRPTSRGSQAGKLPDGGRVAGNNRLARGIVADHGEGCAIQQLLDLLPWRADREHRAGRAAEFGHGGGADADDAQQDFLVKRTGPV